MTQDELFHLAVASTDAEMQRLNLLVTTDMSGTDQSLMQYAQFRLNRILDHYLDTLALYKDLLSNPAKWPAPPAQVGQQGPLSGAVNSPAALALLPLIKSLTGLAGPTGQLPAPVQTLLQSFQSQLAALQAPPATSTSGSTSQAAAPATVTVPGSTVAGS